MPRLNHTPPRRDCPTDSSPAARGPGGRFRRLAAALFVFALLGTALPAAAQTAITLISNTGQGNWDTGSLNTNDQAQAFTTGANAAGYTITGVDIQFAGYTGSASYTVSIWTEVSGSPGSSVDSLTSPSSLTASALNSYTTSGIDLAASTTYFVHVDSSSNDNNFLQNTASNNEDSGGQSGWSIADGSVHRNKDGTGTWLAYPRSKKILIKGSAKTNTAPTVANAIPDQAATAGTAFSYEFPADTFNDADTGDILTYTVTKPDGNPLPTWLSFDDSTRTFKGTPQAADVATVAVKVTASDGIASVSDEFNIVVSAAPAHCDGTDALEIWCATLTVGTRVSDGNNLYGYSASIGNLFGSVTPDTFTYRTATIWVSSLSYVDTAGSRLQLSLGRISGTTPPDGLLGASDFSFEIGTGGTKKSFAIDNPGEYESFAFVGVGQDLSWTTGDTVAFKLLRVPPRVAKRIPNQNASADDEFSYMFPANTFSGGTLTYTATKSDGAMLPTWLSFDASTRIFSGIPTSTDVGTLSVKVTATDTTSRSASDTFDIVVSADIVNQAARVAEAFSYTVPENTFAGASTTGTLTYTARLANGSALSSNTQLAHGRVKPGWLRFNASTWTFWGTPLPGSDGTMSVRVTATDARRARFSATFDITVRVDSGLVGNFTRPGSASRHLKWFNHAQKFTTGAETAGYTVTSIDVLLRDVNSNSDFPTITIESGATKPNSNVATLQTPMSGASGGDKPYRYTAPANLALSANTSYWIVIKGDRSAEEGLSPVTVRKTGWTIIDAGSAAGWSIESKTWRSNIRNPGWSQSPNSSATSLRINGMTIGNQQAVDPPTVTATPAVSAADDDSQWTEGETVEVTIAFSEAVEVDTNDGTPSVGIGLGLGGSEARSADYLRGSGTVELVFGYTLIEGDGDHTAMAVTPDSLTLNGGTIRSIATGVDAALAHNGTIVSGGVRRTPEGPSARFDDLPANHNGSSAFSIELNFSAEPEGLSYLTVQGGLLEVEGGTVTGAKRITKGSNQGWRVTVAPSGDGEIEIRLPARKCGKPNAVCIGGQPLVQAAEATVPGTSSTEPPPEVPFTASFSGAPAEHTGSGSFELEFRLSTEPAGLSYRTVQNGLFDVSGGTIGRAWRLQKGNNAGWGLRIEPSGFGDVTLTVRATTDCGVAPGVCTSDGQMLGGGLQATIAGPPTLSVADAEVDENSDVTLDFAVTLNRVLTDPVTVGYSTADDTASAGADYTNTTGTLTFAAGETLKTVSVPVLDDEHDEGSETMTLTLSNPSPARVKLADAEATGTINNTDVMPQAWLARFGRTVGEQAMEAVETRFEAPRTPGFSGNIAGQGIDGLSGAGAENAETKTAKAIEAAETKTRQGLETLAGWFSGEDGKEADAWMFESRTLTGREALPGSTFAFTEGSKETGFAAFWGRGAVTSFDGQEGELTLDGEVSSAMLGADFSRDALLAGLMVSHSRGEGGYHSPNGNGEVESTLTALFPYGCYALSERVSVWGMAGYGEGTLTLTPENQAPMRPDMDLVMGALGVRGVLLDGRAGGLTLVAKSDAFAVHTSTGAVTGLAASRGDVTQVRLALEGSQLIRLGGDAVLTPSLELGVRHDGGDAETGFGADIGAGLALSSPSRGFSAEIRARGLLTHEADGIRERGISGTLAWDPAPDSDRGISFNLSQTVGGPSTGGADALLARPTLAGIGAQEDEGPLARRLEARLGYGLGVFDDRWTATPELGIGLSDTGREVHLGWRLTEQVSAGLVFEFGMAGTRRESLDGDTGPEHGLGVGFGWRLAEPKNGIHALEMRIQATRSDVANDDRAPEGQIVFTLAARW